MSQYGYLAHHGVKGQKWGIRRYQNKDGSLTAEGKEKYLKIGRNRNHIKKTETGSYKLTRAGANYVNNSLTSLKKYKLNDSISLEKYAKAVNHYKKEGAAMAAILLAGSAFTIEEFIRYNKALDKSINNSKEKINNMNDKMKDIKSILKWRNDNGAGSYEEMDDEYYRRKNMQYPAVIHSELYHHGVKGQKWGVRKQVPTSGRIRSAANRPSPNKRKAIAIAAIGAIGATALVGGGVAIAKNPEAVGRALTSIGGAFAKAPKQKILTAAKATGKGMRKVAFSDKSPRTAKDSAKAIKKAMRMKWVKEDIKNTGKNLVGGVLDGIKNAGKELSSREEVAKTVKVGVKQGVTGAAIAGISGGIGLGVKTAISGKKPTRQEVATWTTKNPNKKK